MMNNLPEWTFEFHGHRCPFMPIGYRMGTLALKKLGVGKSLDHQMHVFSEMGVGHPQGCITIIHLPNALISKSDK